MRIRNVKNKEEVLKQSHHLITEGTLYRGKWNEIFGNDHPIYLEIGMGKGKFLIENARQNPEINFIGIERFDSILARALPNMKEDLNNVRILRINALEVEKVFCREIDRIYLNFSDPWPKKRHQERRLTSPVFLKKYDEITKEKAEIHMKTDNQTLFEYSLLTLSQYGYHFEELSLDLYQTALSDNIATEYEEKFAKMGKRIYKVVASKENV